MTVTLSKLVQNVTAEEAEHALAEGYTLELEDIDTIGIWLSKREPTSQYVLTPNAQALYIFDAGCETLIFTLRLDSEQRGKALAIVRDEVRLERMADELRRAGWSVVAPWGRGELVGASFNETGARGSREPEQRTCRLSVVDR